MNLLQLNTRSQLGGLVSFFSPVQCSSQTVKILTPFKLKSRFSSNESILRRVTVARAHCSWVDHTSSVGDKVAQPLLVKEHRG